MGKVRSSKALRLFLAIGLCGLLGCTNSGTGLPFSIPGLTTPSSPGGGTGAPDAGSTTDPGSTGDGGDQGNTDGGNADQGTGDNTGGDGTGGDGTGGESTGGAPADPDVSDPCVQQGMPVSAVHQQMLDAMNAFRRSQGLNECEYSKVLERAANAHAKDMYDRDFFDHTNPSGEGPGDRAIDAGFCRARLVGENIAWNYQSVAAVQTGWENSPPHRENLVNPGFRYVGMGYYLSPNGPYYVQLFGDVFDEQ